MNAGDCFVHELARFSGLVPAIAFMFFLPE